MKKQALIYAVVFLVLVTAGYFLISEIEKDKIEKSLAVQKSTEPQAALPQVGFIIGGEKPKTAQETKPVSKSEDIVLEVPYVNEAPDGNFTGPWKNACEEASIAMVEKYYLGEKSVSIIEAKNFMQILFNVEDQLWGFNANSDTIRTAEIINKYSSYGAVIKTNPTIQDIKNELDQKRPVITPNYGFGLQNPNIPFAGTGSSYHMIVIIGYNDETREFIVNDSGDIKDGAGYRYDYDLFMNTVHDYDYVTNMVDGPMRAIFTFPK